MIDLHIDLETYSSVDIRKTGIYPYVESIDFEILLFAYAFGDEPVRVVDLAQGEEIPDRVGKALYDPAVRLWAHNAIFERCALRAAGLDIPPERWYCTAILSAYYGLPLSLGDVSKALELEQYGKSSTGKALIRYFCKPRKPTKSNPDIHRNLPHHKPDKWAEFVEYCRQDVVAERKIHSLLDWSRIPDWERELQVLDQRINDRGVLIDLDLVEKAMAVDDRYKAELTDQLGRITKLDNPNSGAQLREWLTEQFGEPITSIAKDVMSDLKTKAEEANLGHVSNALELIEGLGKSSTSKYAAMQRRAERDGRARGILQHYGASTGRWAGRGFQPQNLPRNYLKDLDGARRLLKEGTYAEIKAEYPDVSDYLAQLIRTAVVAPEGHLLCFADFSAIEARVLAWLAGEEWRMEVFRTHGKIYEASASKAFDIPLEDITKDSPWRARGKVIELACGYQGSVGAMTTMGGARLGLSDTEMKEFVDRWRKASPSIVSFWYHLQDLAMAALSNRGRTIKSDRADIAFAYDGTWLICRLPSQRLLHYYKPKWYQNRFGKRAIKYLTRDSTRGNKWGYTGTYGGKLTENITQAVARDMLAYSLLELEKSGLFDTNLHVHDEAGCIVLADHAEEQLTQMCEIMSQPPPWAEGFPLAAEGFVSPYYKK